MNNQTSPDSVQKSTLDNGLKIVTEHVESVKSVAAGIWVKAGSRNEEEHLAGITHFLEHMLFKGTKNRNAYEIALSMEAAGGYLNAFTSNEYTCYYSRCLDSQLPLALDVITDMVQNSLFPEEEVEKEKKVVIEEMKMYRDSPDDYIFEEFGKQLFPGHPLGRPIIGYEETVRSFTRETLIDYVERKYQPSNLLVSIAGNVNHQQVVDYLNDQFGKAGSPQTPVVDPPLVPYNVSSNQFTRPVEQTHMIIGRRGLHYDDVDKYKLLLANTVLGSGMSSRLHQNIREKYGYCYTIGTFNQAYTDTGMFGVYTGTDQNYVDHVRELITAEFNQIQSDIVPDNELMQSKTQLKGKLLLSLESMNNRMTRLAKSELYFDRFITLDELVENIDIVTAEDINLFSNRFFDVETFSETLLLPENGQESTIGAKIP